MDEQHGRHRRVSLGRLLIWALLAAVALCLPASELVSAEERLLRVFDASTGRPKTTFTVEIALTDEEQIRGLQGRDSLQPGSGMLFLYPEATPQAFWMKDVLMPLDIVFADGQGRITEVLEQLPPCLGPVAHCPSYRSRSPARYVLEISAGQASARGLRLGDRLELAP
ncbi:MAG: DUF192 domain-containing protein [bacterium]|nr:DUF192 domain-containing protein [bacterium]MCZ6700371.1 DUF192 domain-containing protein [bacterium]MDV2479702.1 DUF192 domain-containing protein [bacterium]